MYCFLCRVPFFDRRRTNFTETSRIIYKRVRKKIEMHVRNNIEHKHQSFCRYQCKVHTSINDRCPHEGYSISCVVCNVISINHTSNKALETYSYISWTSTCFFFYEIFHNGVFYIIWKCLRWTLVSIMNLFIFANIWHTSLYFYQH